MYRITNNLFESIKEVISVDKEKEPVLLNEKVEELDELKKSEDFEVDEATGVTNYNPKSQGISETSDYFRRREREEAIISGQKPARKKQPAQTSDYARRREQEKKAEKGVAEGLLAEMDKSAPQPGRDGRVSHSTYGSRDKGGSKGPEKETKPITAKKAKQDALDILKKQGVAEGLGDPRDWDEGNRELVNNFAIYINGKKWKVLPGPEGAYADSPQEFRAYAKLQDMCRRKSQETGKQWEVVKTGERPSQDKRGVAEGSNSLPSYLRGESRFVKSAYKTLIKYGFIPDDEDERTSQMGSFKHAKGHMADITWEGNIKLLIKQPNGKYMRLYLDDATEMPKVAAQLQLSPVSTEQGVAEGSLEEGKLGNIIIAFAIAGGSLIGGAAGYESHQNQQRWKAAYEQIKDQDPATAEQIRALIIKYKTAPLKFGPDVLTSKQIDKIISDFENQKLKEQGVAEGSLAEMDKSAPQPGRDGRVSHSTYGSRDKGGSKGPEKEVKPITAKKAKQDALNILKKQGVAEGLGDSRAKLLYESIQRDLKLPNNYYLQLSSHTRNNLKNLYIKYILESVSGVKKDTLETVSYPELKNIVRMIEEKQKGVDGKACWKGYKRMGTKKKGGRTVDNCVKMENLKEKSPPGFKGTVKAMKKHPELTKGKTKDGKKNNPWALAWHMKNKGYKSHKKADCSDKD